MVTKEAGADSVVITYMIEYLNNCDDPFFLRSPSHVLFVRESDPETFHKSISLIHCRRSIREQGIDGSTVGCACVTLNFFETGHNLVQWHQCQCH